MEKDREKEDILIEKGATINRLASELEAAQSRLVNGETTKLKEKVSQLTTERNAAREQVKEMGVSFPLFAISIRKKCKEIQTSSFSIFCDRFRRFRSLEIKI